MLFADVSTGFKAGGFNQAVSLTQPNQLQPFAPERITAYTFGIKNRLLDNKLQLNVEAFYWDYKDLQLSAQAFDGTGNVVLLTQNAGAARVAGPMSVLSPSPGRAARCVDRSNMSIRSTSSSRSYSRHCPCRPGGLAVRSPRPMRKGWLPSIARAVR